MEPRSVRKRAQREATAPAPSMPKLDRSPSTFVEAIGLRAYEKYCLRGRLDGFDRLDWLEAEQELTCELLGTVTVGRPLLPPGEQ